MKKYSFLFPIASLCWCLFGCNEDSGFGFPEGDVENPKIRNYHPIHD